MHEDRGSLNQLTPSEEGYSLLESLIGMGMITFLGVGAATFFSNTHKQSSQIRSQASFSRVVSAIQTYVSIPSTFRANLIHDADESLTSCLTGGASFVSDEVGDCQGGVWNPIEIRSPFIGPPPNYEAGGFVTGVPTKALPYDSWGAPCQEDMPIDQCPFEVYTEVRAQCPAESIHDLTPVSVCDVAELIEVKFVVQPRQKELNQASIKSHSIVIKTVSLSVSLISGYAPRINYEQIPPPAPSEGYEFASLDSAVVNEELVPPPSPEPQSHSQAANFKVQWMGEGKEKEQVKVTENDFAKSAIPPVPLRCPGRTVRSGKGCVCPKGTSLVDFRKALCSRISI